MHEASIYVKSVHMIKSLLNYWKSEKNMEIKDILNNLHLKDRLQMEFTAC